MKRLSPWQQGELDGLCGIYAIINAMKTLVLSRGYDFDDAHGATLFKMLLLALHKRNRLPRALWDGTSTSHVRDFLSTAKRFMRRQYKLELVYQRLAAPGQVTRKDVFWRVLDAALTPGSDYRFRYKTEHQRVALVGLGHPTPHWTLAYEVSPKTIKLIDSGNRVTLQYNKCTVGESHPGQWIIEPESTMIMSTLPDPEA